MCVRTRWMCTVVCASVCTSTVATVLVIVLANGFGPDKTLIVISFFLFRPHLVIALHTAAGLCVCTLSTSPLPLSLFNYGQTCKRVHNQCKFIHSRSVYVMRAVLASSFANGDGLLLLLSLLLILDLGDALILHVFTL